MDKREAILNFANQRPPVRAVYGYGSGVFKQANLEGEKTLTDAIFVVENIGEWHLKNMHAQPHDYSIIGKIYLSRKNIAKLKGKNKITYFSQIREGEFIFKYGVIEIRDFINSLTTWNNIFMAGRFQKPVMEIFSNDEIRESIAYNRYCALIIACLFLPKFTTVRDIYLTLCGLSYRGDARMRIAENPHKVENIVDGSYDYFTKIYPLDEDFLFKMPENDVIKINHRILISHLEELPPGLLEYLYEVETDMNDLDMVRINVNTYLFEKNKVESRAQIFNGLKSNGVFRSIPYVLAKVKKRFKKR